MIENIEQMRARHQKEIAELQRLCPHKTSKRMLYEWAPGHSMGDVDVCNFCGKILKKYWTSQDEAPTQAELDWIRGIISTRPAGGISDD